MTTYKNIVKGYKSAQKVVIFFHADEAKPVGWMHVECARHSETSVDGEFSAFPIGSVDKEIFDAANEPCSLCGEFHIQY